MEFLDITADEDKLQPPPLGEVVKTMMLEAKKHKSFQALFKLQAIKNYHLVPNIRDPVTQVLLLHNLWAKVLILLIKFEVWSRMLNGFNASLPTMQENTMRTHLSLIMNEFIKPFVDI